MSEYAPTTKDRHPATRPGAGRQSLSRRVTTTSEASAITSPQLRTAPAGTPAVHAVAQFHAALNAAPRATALARLSQRLQAPRGTTVVQRAVVAIDGDNDDDAAKAITRSCLANLTTRKRIAVPEGGRTPKQFPAGDARGAVYGPAAANPAFAGLAADAAGSAIKTDESIYVLGHGDGLTVGGLDAATLASKLAGSLSARPAVYRGAVKLVACYSGSLVMDGQQILDPKTKAPLDKSYAASLAQALGGAKTEKFQPAGAEGIAGIAWVDEISGQKTGLDVLGEGAREMNPAERLYTDPAKVQSWFAAMQEKDPLKRWALMEAILEKEHQPGEKALPTRRFGKEAKRWFATA